MQTPQKPLNKMLSSLVLAAAALCAGCSQIVPGLHVRAGEEGDHAYTEAPPTPVGVKPKPAQVQKYRVINVDPEVVADLLELQQLAPADAPPKLPVVLPSDVPAEYRIGPSDVVFVTVWEHPELTMPYQGQVRDVAQEGRLVAADGSMYYPYVGTFLVQGMTAPALRDYLTKQLTKAIVNPKVDVRVVAYRASRIQVTGEVKSAGTVTLDDVPKGILQALDASGGLTPDASRRYVWLLRGGKSYRIDLANLLSGEANAGNPKLEPGDEIRVPNKSQDKIYVLGEVDRQKPVVLDQGTMPLVEALAEAGGLARLSADDSGVLVFRLNPPGTDIAATVYALDMSTPAGLLLADQFPLEPRDIVYVKATAFAQYNLIVEQIMPTVQTVFEANRISRGWGPHSAN